MLNEGRRRHDRGTDVVVGFVETHGRRLTAEAIGDLELVPRLQALRVRVGVRPVAALRVGRLAEAAGRAGRAPTRQTRP